MLVNEFNAWLTENEDLSIVLGVVLGLLAALGPAMMLIGTIISFVLSPIGLLISGIVGLFLAFKNNFMGITDFFQPVIDALWPVINGFQTFWAALTASYIQKKNYSVDILDANAENLDFYETARVIEERSPRLINIVGYGQHPSASTPLMTGIGELSRKIKDVNKNSKIILTGIHASALPKKTLMEEMKTERSNISSSHIPEVKWREYWRVLIIHKWVVMLGIDSLERWQQDRCRRPRASRSASRACQGNVPSLGPADSTRAR